MRKLSKFEETNVKTMMRIGAWTPAWSDNASVFRPSRRRCPLPCESVAGTSSTFDFERYVDEMAAHGVPLPRWFLSGIMQVKEQEGVRMTDLFNVWAALNIGGEIVSNRLAN